MADHFTYDEFGGLRAVLSTDGPDITYELDATGRRVGKSIDGTPVRGWLYQDALNPIAELDATGTVVTTFVYATMGHVPDYMLTAGETYRIVTDHLGSVRLVVNVTDGTVAQRIDYDQGIRPTKGSVRRTRGIERTASPVGAARRVVGDARRT